MGQTRILAGSAVLVVSAGVSLAGFLLLRAQPPAATAFEGGWNEARWSMPRDQWGEGLAFRCAVQHCGGDIEVHVRAKLGFCDCAKGIVDDDHLDRIGDADLLGGREPVAEGKAVSVRSMNGRMRRYAATGSGGRAADVLSVAINDRCDVIVATALAGGGTDAALTQAQERSVLSLLEGATVQRWAERTLGL
ncbi:MAG: hypothetical protein JWN93_777 [Hyphomicrobiales bacterium]|nr:hypothetical protein [Hyphomicrobiales bacterium]